MSHAPNFGTSQWHKPLDPPWGRDASCRKNQHLPWTGEGPQDKQPAGSTLHYMREICDECPVRTACADYALTCNKGYGAEGGMYAGVWLPWTTRSGKAEVKEQRRRARRVLRSIAYG